MSEAFLFDMDGVVADDISIDFAAWKKIFSEHGKKLTLTKYKKFTGKKSTEIIKKYIDPKISEKNAIKIQTRKEKYFIQYMQKKGLKSPSGLKEFLAELAQKKNRKQKYKIALATAADKYKTNKILSYLKVGNYFKIKITADDVKKGKPDPEIFLKAAKKLNCRPSECVVIEDSPLGITAAKKAGMKAIGILTTHSRKSLRKAGADIIIKDFNELNNELKLIILKDIKSHIK